MPQAFRREDGRKDKAFQIGVSGEAETGVS